MTQKPRNYIGIACSSHDPALAILGPEGEVRFAEASERYLQNKRAFSSPADDLNHIARLVEEYCDPEAELVVAKSWHGRRYAFERVLARSLRLLANSRKLAQRLGWRSGGSEEVLDMLFAMPSYFWETHANSVRQASLNLGIQRHLLNRGPRQRLIHRRYSHQLTHAATACLTSPFDEAVCAVIDAMGEGTSTSYYRYTGGRVVPLTDVRTGGMGSLGAFYSLCCELCGFDSLKGEEWKVMGLAPYGQFDQNIYDILRPLIRVKGLRLISRYSTKGFDEIRRKPNTSPLTVANLAFTAQEIFEQVQLQLLRTLHARGISNNLVYGGGCALNSTLNGIVTQRTGFENLHIYSAPSDDGNALGAALLAHREDHPSTPAPRKLMSPYLGSRPSPEKLGKMARLGALDISEPESVHQAAAELLAEGKIIGWMEGRAEYGPRALGNRSILANPATPGIKDRINALVKFREEFRPFAPAILHERGPDFFEGYQFSPYMERTLPFREEVKGLVPGVVHVNGTGRVQSVTAELHPSFRRLIEIFDRLTGIPLLLNTSFNVMGKPIVHSVEDAIAAFYTTGLDALVIEGLLVVKPGVRESKHGSQREAKDRQTASSGKELLCTERIPSPLNPTVASAGEMK